MYPDPEDQSQTLQAAPCDLDILVCSRTLTCRKYNKHLILYQTL